MKTFVAICLYVAGISLIVFIVIALIGELFISKLKNFNKNIEREDK